MIDKGKKIDMTVGNLETRDHVYAVNKSGDFSKKSVKEAEWPQNADKKQPLSEINENKSEGAKRFEDVIRRVIETGNIPRGFTHIPISINSPKDNAMGIITLPTNDMNEKMAEKIKEISGLIDEARNVPDTFIWTKSKAKMTSPNDSGHEEKKTGRVEQISVIQGIPIAGGEAKSKIEIADLKNRDLTVIR